jgi:hypothetical protein
MAYTSVSFGVWLLFTMGPNWLLGCKIVTGVPDAIPVMVVQLLNYYIGGVGVVNQL